MCLMGCFIRTHRPSKSTTWTRMASRNSYSGYLCCWHFVLHRVYATSLIRRCIAPRKQTDYGVLTPVLKKDIREDLIVRHWDDMNRLAASLKDGLVRPSLVVSKLQAMQRQNPLQQAVQELGGIGKTGHILHYVDDPPFRRRVR